MSRNVLRMTTKPVDQIISSGGTSCELAVDRMEDAVYITALGPRRGIKSVLKIHIDAAYSVGRFLQYAAAGPLERQVMEAEDAAL